MAADAHRLASIANRTRSDNDSEALSALRILHRQLDALNLRLGDLIEERLTPRATNPLVTSAAMWPVTILRPHERQLREALAFSDCLTAWEAEFCRSLWGKKSLSDRQQATLSDIVSSVRRKREQVPA